MRIWGRVLFGGVALSVAHIGASSQAQDSTEERIKRLEAIIQKQQETIGKQEQRLKEIETRRSSREVPPGTTRTAARPSTEVTTQPFLDGTSAMFKAIAEDGLAQIRGGMLPAYRVQLPDGRDLLVSPVALSNLWAQTQPRDPGFEVEPERPAVTPPPPRRPPVRAAPVRRPPPPAKPPPATPPATPAGQDDSERAKAQKTQDQALLERGAILLRPGALQIETGFEYSKSGGNQVQISGVSIFDAIIIGTIRVDAQDRDVITSMLKMRYGVINRVQVDATVPWVYRRDREILGIGTPTVTERITDARGLGDIEIGVSGQPVIARGWIPNVLTRVSVRMPTGKSGFQIPTVRVGAGNDTRLERPPTGNGFWATSGTVTAVWSIDPVVIFVGGGYTINWPRSWGGFGRVDPGDSFEFFAGLNFALNDRVSFNFSFINSRTFSTRRDHEKVVNTQFTDARAVFGTSIGISRNVSVVMNAGIGLTSSSPNFTFYVGIPISFQTY